MSTHENVQLVRELYSALARGDMDVDAPASDTPDWAPATATRRSRTLPDLLAFITFHHDSMGAGDTDRKASWRNHPLIERARTSRVPVEALVGFSIEPLGDGQAVGWLDAGPQHPNPMGTLHGDILCDVADAAMGMAFVTTLGPDESFTTMSLTINFFRPVWEARLRFDARVANRSGNTGYLECEITDQDRKRIAKATCNCTVLRSEQARVR